MVLWQLGVIEICWYRSGLCFGVLPGVPSVFVVLVGFCDGVPCIRHAIFDESVGRHDSPYLFRLLIGLRAGWLGWLVGVEVVGAEKATDGDGAWWVVYRFTTSLSCAERWWSGKVL